MDDESLVKRIYLKQYNLVWLVRKRWLVNSNHLFHGKRLYESFSLSLILSSFKYENYEEKYSYGLY